MTLAKHETVSDSTMVHVVGSGDLAGLSPGQKVEYYNAVCLSTGLNPLTKPFDFISFKGKVVLYPNRNCVDQLVSMQELSVDYSNVHEDLERKLVIQWATVSSPGRSLKDMAVLSTQEADKQGKLHDLTGQDYGNLLMKLLTKCRRRAVLAFSGLPYDGLTPDDDGAIETGVVSITTPSDAELAASVVLKGQIGPPVIVDQVVGVNLGNSPAVDTDTGEIMEPEPSDAEQILTDAVGPPSTEAFQAAVGVPWDDQPFDVAIAEVDPQPAPEPEVLINDWERLTEEIVSKGMTLQEVLPKGSATIESFELLGGTAAIARKRFEKLKE